MNEIEQLKQLFVNRTDCHCIQLTSGRYQKIDQPLTDQHLKQHLNGTLTVGSYQLNRQNQVKWFCYDLDPEKLADPKTTAQQILTAMRQKTSNTDNPNKAPQPLIWDNSLVLEASRYPDNSYHIWVLFMTPVTAKVARWLALRILELAEQNPKQLEVFPKQNEITPERPYGNFVKLPFGLHQVEQKYSRLLHLDTFEPIPLTELETKTGLSLPEKDQTTIENQQNKTTVQMSITAPQVTRSISEKNKQQRIDLLAKYWKSGYRNQLVISFCGYCIKNGYSHQQAREIILAVCQKTETNPSDTAEFLYQVDYQFQNRTTLGNLKGISGLIEVINAQTNNPDQAQTEADLWQQ